MGHCRFTVAPCVLVYSSYLLSCLCPSGQMPAPAAAAAVVVGRSPARCPPSPRRRPRSQPCARPPLLPPLRPSTLTPTLYSHHLHFFSSEPFSPFTLLSLFLVCKPSDDAELLCVPWLWSTSCDEEKPGSQAPGAAEFDETTFTVLTM